jgi:hypothetical protein
MGLVISKGLTLKSYNTPAAIAGVAPTLDYRFALDRREIEAISLTDKLTYTGATNGTFINRSGLIERATTDQPRFDHGPASRQSLGLLVEEGRTNLLVNSTNLLAPIWTSSAGVTRTVDLSRGQPVSNENVYRINFPGADLTGLGQAVTSASGTAHSLSMYVLGVAGESTRLGSQNLGAQNHVLTGEWQRITTTGTSSSTGLSFTFSTFGSATAREIFVTAPQLEVGAFPTSYIPTTTTALTRTVDSAVIDGTGVITGTYTLVEKPAGCAVVNGTNIDLVSGFTAERVMVFPAALSAPQITAIRGAM